jgi:hypothetical protein
MVSGGCFCGAVRYAVSGEPLHSTLCHCSDCRRVAGAPAVAWFTMRVDDFRITSGVPRRLQSSGKVERTFCGACGTGLTYQHADLPGEIDVTSGSLDAPEGMAPEDHTFVGSRLRWLRMEDGLPEYETVRMA